MAKDFDSKADTAEKAYAEAASAVPAKPGADAKPAVKSPEPKKAVAKKASPKKIVKKAAAGKPKPKVATAKPQAPKPEPVKAPAKVEATAAEPVAVTAKEPEVAPPEPKPAPQAVEAKAPEPVAPAPEKASAEPKPSPAPAKTEASPAKTNKAPEPSITELKEKIMATAKTPDFSKTVTDAMSEMQTRAKEAYDKSTEMAGEMTEFAKGNVEALVESSKIFAAGMQDLGKNYAEEAKSAYETVTGDMKEMASVKSPTELFQLQGKLMRRNFDSLVATSSKNTEALVKLANESFAPLSGRMSLAAEKISKAA